MQGMRKRLPATLILVSLLCWSVLPALASPELGGPVTPKADRSRSHSARNHSCCPGSHAQIALSIFSTLPPANMPCSDRPCCVRQGPENSPSLPALNRIFRPDSQQIYVGGGLRNLTARGRIQAEMSTRDAFDFNSVRSTVLRN
jgi:hypothetical protein